MEQDDAERAARREASATCTTRCGAPTVGGVVLALALRRVSECTPFAVRRDSSATVSRPDRRLQAGDRWRR